MHRGVNFRSVFLVVGACTVVAVVAFGLPGEASHRAMQQTPIKDRSFSGEQLFEGIFFGRGPAAQELADFNLDELSRTPRIREVSQRTLSEITAADSGYLAAFASEIQSGSHTRVQRALQGGAKRVVKTLTAMYRADKGEEPEMTDLIKFLLPASRRVSLDAQEWEPPDYREAVPDYEVKFLETIVFIAFGITIFLFYPYAAKTSRLEADEFTDVVTRRFMKAASRRDAGAD